MGLIKVAAFAEQMGISPQAVRKAISEGRLKDSVQRDGRSWLVDDQLAAAEWDRNTAPQFQRGRMAERQQAQAAVVPPAGLQNKIPSQSQAAAVRTWYQAKLLELDLKQRNGELVSAAEMQRVRFESGRRVRDAVLRLGQQMIGDIARAAGALTPDQRSEVLLVIERHHVKALEALADGNG
jgi:hypothetical protein